MDEDALPPLPIFHAILTCHSSLSPAFRDKIRKMARSLSPLVQVDTGRIHPDFPRYLVNFWLLTHDQLDSLAEFYHQRHVGPLTFEYPIRVQWPEGMSLEQKRRRFGRFIGLRGCESPGMPPIGFDNFKSPSTTSRSSTAANHDGSEAPPHSHSWFLEQLLIWRNDPTRNNTDWYWDEPTDHNPENSSLRRSRYASSRSRRGLSRSRARSQHRRARSSSMRSRTAPQGEEETYLPVYRPEPDPDVEMTIPSEPPPEYSTLAPEFAHLLADGPISPLNPSRRRPRDPEDDERLFRKARGFY
jgi:hypothetical protein